MVDMYDRRVMLTVLEQLYPVKTGFLTKFFPGAPQQSQALSIDLDVIKGGRRMAPICHPRGKGTPMQRYGYTTQTIKPPSCKPKMELTSEDLLKRLPGEVIYSPGQPPAMLAMKQMNQDLSDLKETIIRREEWMAATGLQNGVIPLVGKNVNQTIDFLFDASHIIVLSGGAEWNDVANSSPQKNIRYWKRQIQRDSGIVPDCMICGSEVIDALYAHVEQDAGLAKMLDNRRVEGLVSINPAPMPEGMEYIGTIEGVKIYSYDEWYEDAAGTLYPMMNTKKIVMGSTKARCTRHYGAIQHLKATAVVPYFPVTWDEVEDGVSWLMVISSPLPAIHQPDAFMVITAVT